MNIIKRVLIKQVVTEKSKIKMKKNFDKHKMQLEQECQQLLFEQRKLHNKSGVSKEELTRRFQKEISKRKDEIRLTEFKINQLDMIPMGSEMIEQEVEALVEVQEGMHWNELMESGAIVVEDDIIVRIEE